MMPTVKELLKNSLENLGKDDLKKFHWQLKNGEQSIPQSELENAGILDTVDRMVEYFKQEGAVKVTVDILEKIKQNDQAEILETKYNEVKAKRSVPDTSDNYSAVVTHFQPPAQTTTVGTGTNAPVPVCVQQPVGVSPHPESQPLTQTTQDGTGTNVSVLHEIQGFLQSRPKAFGIAQIIIGLLTLLLGIVSSAFHAVSLFLLFGIAYWGSLIYIITGSLSIAAEIKLNSPFGLCLVKGSLGMNIFSALTAGISIILISLDLVIIGSSMPVCHGYECDPLMFMNQLMGISSVLLVFAFFELIISINLSAFACKATCCSSPQAQPI
ncbi:membrane-spanning 4-domains subfamily A member 8-like isoform X2 [Pseudorasbora parva]|uniref:membrane-spanning 4-domains subfamily A member 8-like isoform X2 n=1 Tax=Pseudorasbora parva TaxID=51549 RepID=UPI00351F2088